MKRYTGGMCLFALFLCITLGPVKIAVADQPTDDTITSRAREALREDPRVDDSKIKVSTRSGIVTLTGELATPYQKERATRDCLMVENVKNVKYYMTINAQEDMWVRKKARQPSDSELEKNVRDELREDLRVADPFHIDVEALKGHVTLSGDVNTVQEKEHAADVASRVLGVTEVINLITVNRTIRRSDRALKDRLAADWETHPVADRIQVSVKGGVVTLAGDVDTWSESKEAARIASLTYGVWEVLNRLRVKDVDYPWDEYINKP